MIPPKVDFTGAFPVANSTISSLFSTLHEHLPPAPFRRAGMIGVTLCREMSYMVLTGSIACHSQLSTSRVGVPTLSFGERVLLVVEWPGGSYY